MRLAIRTNRGQAPQTLARQIISEAVKALIGHTPPRWDLLVE
jgi:hypothetical protein